MNNLKGPIADSDARIRHFSRALVAIDSPMARFGLRTNLLESGAEMRTHLASANLRLCVFWLHPKKKAFRSVNVE